MLNGDYSSPTLPNPITIGVHICAIEEDSRSLLKPNATGRQICGVEEQLTVCKTHPSSASISWLRLPLLQLPVHGPVGCVHVGTTTVLLRYPGRPKIQGVPTLHVPALCPVSVGLVGAKDQSDRARILPHQVMTLSCICEMMSYTFNNHCVSLKQLFLCYALLLSFCYCVCKET
ncbi:uncharacterized protein LOC114263057 isoform X1 [Camellia sinensis]|uniref:uncharacterized protein LOC114263057 isoform X1 n=1 Tax=Camellia sinensis TaxID=4442 RepID=UPI0010357FFB|nr:uncharacterized protein LOC114263057 isoform X1 [Camellia sinensis]